MGGAWLKEYQKRLGFEAGFDRTYTSRIESGINSPPIRMVVKLAARARGRGGGVKGYRHGF